MYICIGSDEKYSIQWYTMKSGGFHDEIQQISWWNLADFMKSGGFHDFSWNQADFMADLEKCKVENVKFYNAYNFYSM